MPRTQSSRGRARNARAGSSSTTRCSPKRGSRTYRVTGEWRASCKPIFFWTENMEVHQMSTAKPIELHGRRGRIVVHRWSTTAPRFVALVAHGYGEHAGRYGHVAERLVAEGATVYAPDFEGHGLSQGDRARFDTVDDLADELASVDKAARGAYPGLPVISSVTHSAASSRLVSCSAI